MEEKEKLPVQEDQEEQKEHTEETQPESPPISIHQWENTYDMLDIFKDIIVFLFVTGFAFGWMMLMLLLISFFMLSYLHFNIKVMFIVSVLAGVAAGVWHIVKTVKKYSGMTRRPRRKR